MMNFLPYYYFVPVAIYFFFNLKLMCYCTNYNIYFMFKCMKGCCANSNKVQVIYS